MASKVINNIQGILDTSSLTNDNDHIPTSGAVKSAIDNPVAIKIEAASASESVATYNARLDAVLATMENNSCMLVEAYPPQIWAKGVCLCVLYKYNANTASLQTVSDTDATHRCNFVIAKNSGTWGDIEYFATKSALLTPANQKTVVYNASITIPVSIGMLIWIARAAGSVCALYTVDLTESPILISGTASGHTISIANGYVTIANTTAYSVTIGWIGAAVA